MDQLHALRCLERLASAFDADPSDQRVVVYVERLMAFDGRLVEAAVENAIDRCRYFPSVAELLDVIDDTKADLAVEASGSVLPERATWTEDDELEARRAMKAAMAEWRARRSGHPSGDHDADEA